MGRCTFVPDVRPWVCRKKRWSTFILPSCKENYSSKELLVMEALVFLEEMFIWTKKGFGDGKRKDKLSWIKTYNNKKVIK